MNYIDFPNGRFYIGDCLEIIPTLPACSVDMILCDLPYGTTSCAWDSIIPMSSLWPAYENVAKIDAAIVLTATQPFTTLLISDRVKKFKYSWVWDKISVTGFSNAHNQPLRHLEDVLVFYDKKPVYNPQGLKTHNKSRKNSASDGGATVKGEHLSNGRGSLRTPGLERVQEFTNFPRQRLEISRERGIHPTQKPVALFEYLIRTYTNENETVLDNCAGSGTTAIAAENAGRKWICIEKDGSYADAALARIYDHIYGGGAS